MPISIDGSPYGTAIDDTIRGAEKLAAEKTWKMLAEMGKGEKK